MAAVLDRAEHDGWIRRTIANALGDARGWRPMSAETIESLRAELEVAKARIAAALASLMPCESCATDVVVRRALTKDVS